MAGPAGDKRVRPRPARPLETTARGGLAPNGPHHAVAQAERAGLERAGRVRSAAAPRDARPLPICRAKDLSVCNYPSRPILSMLFVLIEGPPILLPDQLTCVEETMRGVGGF